MMRSGQAFYRLQLDDDEIRHDKICNVSANNSTSIVNCEGSFEGSRQVAMS